MIITIMFKREVNLLDFHDLPADFNEITGNLELVGKSASGTVGVYISGKYFSLFDLARHCSRISIVKCGEHSVDLSTATAGTIYDTLASALQHGILA